MHNETKQQVTYDDLAEQTANATRMMCAANLDAFRRLREFDSELAEQAIETCGAEASAAAFLARERADYDGESAYRMLASGQRDRVLHVLRAISHGVYL